MTVPSVAHADMADCSKKLEVKYSKRYNEVRRRHGKRAPGRNIRKYGWVKRNQTVRNATCKEIRTSVKQLDQLLYVPPRYRSVPTATTLAVNPAQAPSGVQTAVTTSTGGSSNPYVDPQCESGGNPQVKSPEGYWGKYQFDLGTWEEGGGSKSTYGNASEIEQDRVASNIHRDAWPNC